jgi:HK97 family phage major capsid protein
MKKILMELLAKKKERKAAIQEEARGLSDVDKLTSLNAELDTINEDIRKLEEVIAGLPDDEPDTRGAGAPAAAPGAAVILGTYGMGTAARSADTELGKYETLEYRKAFMDFVLTGKVTEALQLRDDATTKTTDISAIIPTTIMNKVVEKMADYGRIYAKITKTNFKGGLDIPVSSLKPKATWQTEGTLADKQKKTITSKISFSYYKLQVRIAISLESDTVSLAVFESVVASNINEAIVVAIETASISGTGTGEPLGITKDTGVPAAQIITVDPAKLGEYKTWVNFFAKVPRKYRAGCVLILNDADWNNYCVGMVDANGQPVARVTYGINGEEQERFMGKEVIPVEDYLESVDAADSGEIFGIICRLEDYAFNSNMQLTVRKYFDEDTDEWITKATVIGDGKLADPNGVVLLKKK